jgi:hypothetical protein
MAYRFKNLAIITCALFVAASDSALADSGISEELCDMMIDSWNLLDASLPCSSLDASYATIGGHESPTSSPLRCPRGFSPRNGACDHAASGESITGWAEVELAPEAGFDRFLVDYEKDSPSCPNGCGCGLEMLVFTSTACTHWTLVGVPSSRGARAQAVFAGTATQAACVLIGRSDAADDVGVLHLWRVRKSKTIF